MQTVDKFETFQRSIERCRLFSNGEMRPRDIHSKRSERRFLNSRLECLVPSSTSLFSVFSFKLIEQGQSSLKVRKVEWKI